MGDPQESVRAIEFYSGIGGLHLALRRSGIPGAVVAAAYDWDQTACQTYAANFGDGIVHKTDITTLTAADISRLNADLWLLSPSCQPYTVLNPLAKGAADPRAKSFLHLIDNVLPELSIQSMHPRHLLVENVGGFQDSTTRCHLVSTLRRLGYVTAEFTLNPLQIGIPNSRLRYYLLAKLAPLRFVGLDSTKPNNPLDYIPPRDPHAEFQQMSDLGSAALVNYIDSMTNEETFAQFKIPDRVLNKWGRLFDIVLPSSTRTCCFTRGYTRLVERAGSILQMNESLDTTQVFDLFLSARARGDESAVRILDPLRLRYFTPAELLRIFHFTNINAPSSNFTWPPGVSTKSKYRLIGNSVNVEVVRKLIIYLFTEPWYDRFPITNVNDNCCTGSTILLHATDAVKKSHVGRALSPGIKHMVPGTIVTHFTDRPSPTALWAVRTVEQFWTCGSKDVLQCRKEFCAQYGAKV